MPKRVQAAFLRERFWHNYVDEYVNEPGYWYQPKGLAISPANLPLIKKRLRELSRLDGKRWSRVQHRYTQTLAKKKLVSLKKPIRSYTRADFSAIGRMNKVIFDTLGLAWINEESTVFITDVGKRFLEATDLEKVVQEQLTKYQFSNPAFGSEQAAIKLFPHLFLLDVLLAFPEHGISKQEYVLFVSRAHSHQELNKTKGQIDRFRKLDADDQKALVSHLKTIPIVKKGRISTKGRRTSIFNTISLNSSYSLSFFALPKYITVNNTAQIVIPRGQLGKVIRVVREAMSTAYFTEFANEKDWFSYYGDPKRSGSVMDAMEYYENRSDVNRAVGAFLAARQRGAVRKMEPGEYVELRVKEKMLEDLLEFNLYLLEPGLDLVGRQYPTPTGPIDLLAQDARRQYVVIELKKAKASDKVVGQLQRYRGYVLQELARPKQRVRGMIVSRSVDRKLRYAVRGLHAEPVQLFKFAFQADVTEVEA